MIFSSQLIWLLRYHVYLPQRLSSSAWCSPDLFTEHISYSLSGFFVDPLHPPQLPSGLFWLIQSVQYFVYFKFVSLVLDSTLEYWIILCMCVCVCTLNQVQFFATPFAVAHQVTLSMGFSRQEQWRGLSFPTPGDLPDPGIKPASESCPIHHLLLAL